eukprot:4521863-Heterocapsa_arctica.AAC.1
MPKSASTSLLASVSGAGVEVGGVVLGEGVALAPDDEAPDLVRGSARDDVHQRGVAGPALLERQDRRE